MDSVLLAVRILWAAHMWWGTRKKKAGEEKMRETKN